MGQKQVGKVTYSSSLSGFELKLAIGLMTPKEMIEWQETRDKQFDYFISAVDIAEQDAKDCITKEEKSNVDIPTLKKDKDDVNARATAYRRACQPPKHILEKWNKQKQKLAQVHEEFKKKYMTSPEYKARREYAAEWRKKNNIKGDGW